MAVFHAETALLPQGWARDVLIESDAAGMIRRVETAASPPPGALRLAVVVPGMPNLHSHAFQRAMAGRAERRGPGTDTFWTWREAMYALVARITPATQRAIAAMVQAECLERGYTHLCEFHYLHRRPDGSPWPEADAMAEGHIAAALEESGIGLTLLPSLYRYGGIFGRDPAPGQRPFLLELAEYLALLRRLERFRGNRIALGVAPHSLRAVSPDMLAAVAQATDGPIHIHLAEQRREVEECLAATGLTPGAWMLARGHAGPRWCFIHATHLTAAELAELAASGAVAGLCPQTEASLGDGIFALPEWLAAGGRIGIGSDSQVCLDPAGELRQLETSQRLKLEQRAIAGSRADPHPGARLFRAALAGGAQAAGAPIGAITAGKRCDLVELDPDHPDLIGLSGDALL
ncbi:MAG: formimidoylglutamate deiminase, partial [Rhodovarius sp.]|nr:formimidoylglutamate deiminase [Rhodovarius sp.]